MAFLLLVAGHETTVNLIGNGVLTCCATRTSWPRLRADPALLPSAVEEFLRLRRPGQHRHVPLHRRVDTLAGKRSRPASS